ncbi:MAG: hypothetical protein F4Z87_01300 [Gammaproteobacteria bacterium]|nr:hypothetical protein [Gammaproteobacteria bacterium]
MTIERLQSQSWALPLYAEAAPDTFLTIFERDLTEDNPVVFQLMQPCNNAMFERSDRVDILSALELLAWNKKWISRVVDILAQLAASEPVDNLYNKPSNSLETIFHLRMPQTALPVEDRIMVFDRLIERHPQVAWNIAIRQFGRLSQVGHYNHKPRWSDDAIGFGGTSNRNEKNRFKEHCIEKCIHWPSHSCSTLTDMVKRATWIPGKMLSQLQVIITDWAETASDEERVQLREEVRISLRRKRSRTQDKNAEKEVVSFAKAVFDLLEPQDVVWRHAWLFREHWVDESRDELEMNDDVNYEQRTNHIHNLRMSAIREVTSASGYSGVLELAFSGNAPFVVGWSLADTLTDDESRLNFLNDVLESGDILNSEQHQSILEGFLRALDTPTTIKLIDQLWSQHNEDIGIRLLCLAKCDGLVWQAVEERGESVSRKYWTRVRPTWNNPPAFEQNYAVSRLLDLKRVEVAFNSALIEIKQIESRLIYRILSELPFHNSQDSTAVNIGVHQIRRAFRVLNDRNSLNQSEMATLEFLYVEMFPFDDPNIQNLEREIEYSPQLFAELISMAFKKEDSKENRSLTENEREFAKKARRVLEVLSRIPGVQGDGSIDEIKLMAWIEQVRVLCASNGQSRLGDEYIGQLLSNAPIGEDEVWPNASIRSVLEKVLNQNVENGFHVGKQNSIGFEEIVDGGRVPRDRAHQYEDWAKVCDYKYPKVAALLRRMSEDNLEYAEWEDNHASIERRVGY